MESMTEIIENAFKYQKAVSFFLRLHRHLPDGICNEMFVCNYRKDGKPINEMNDYVEELQKDPIFRHKEKEVVEAQKIGKKLFAVPYSESKQKKLTETTPDMIGRKFGRAIKKLGE